MFQTIIRNLVSNSLKFTPQGGKITIDTNPVNDFFVEISVADTGIGMGIEMLENLFSMDVNSKRPGIDGEHSTGLGLLLCKEFVERHGGEIKVESQVQKGTRFSFTIPLKEPKEEIS
jgi:signal transduction histidine kinase